MVEPGDVVGWLPPVPLDSHKWKSAVWVVAGSPGMTGAAALAARGAQRAGAGYVRLSTPGLEHPSAAAVEVVATPLPAVGWAKEVLDGVDRFKAVVVGPGLGADVSVDDVRELVEGSPVPVVVDGDGLRAVVGGGNVILTPHDGEYERITGSPPGPDRFEAARALAASTGAVVLLKGSATIVAAPDGRVLVAVAPDARLATAGTGDVLSGIVGALAAGGVDPFRAAAAGAFIHQRAATLGFGRGLVAGDLPDLVPVAVERLVED